MDEVLAKRLDAIESVLRRAHGTSDRGAAGRLLAEAQHMARAVVAAHGGEVAVPTTLEALRGWKVRLPGYWQDRAS